MKKNKDCEQAKPAKTGFKKYKALCIVLGTIIAIIAAIKVIIKISEKKRNQTELKEYLAFFSTKLYALAEKIPAGILLSEYFSILKTDFTQCEFSDNTFISIKSVCGGLTVYIPENVNVKFDYINNFSIIKSDFDEDEYDASKPTVYIALKGFASVVSIKKKEAEEA